MPASGIETNSKYEQSIVDNVQEHGWFCPYIFDPDGNDPDFAYTVGFTETLNCPEFIVFSLGKDLMHSMLWQVFREIREGKIPEDGQRWSNLLEGYDCIIRAVHPTNIVREYLNSAMWFWEKSEEKAQLKAFQLIWPCSETGLFPWEEGCPQNVSDLQPPLYLPKADKTAPKKGILGFLKSFVGKRR